MRILCNAEIELLNINVEQSSDREHGQGKAFVQPRSVHTARERSL